MPRKLALLLALSAGVILAQSSNGIWVDQPKVYDDYFLQTQLNALKTQLSGLSGLDQTVLSSSIGAVQGATLQASGITVQAAGPAPPQVTTLTPPSSLSGGAAASGAYGTTTTGAAMTPSVPTAPQTSLTLPSSLSQSSMNNLSEMMQLSYQIINYEMLLEGSLTDSALNGKRHVSVGLSITVDPPEKFKKDLENALAEVEITILNPAGVPPDMLPSVITLLPREKTYNVIGMVDHQLSLGAGGILVGVVNLGLSWTLQRQKAYVYQQQDTLAVETGPSTFAWQFRPVLDKKYVTSGTRQMFLQFSISSLAAARDVHLSIRTRWRKVDAKTGLVSEAAIEETQLRDFVVPFVNTTPLTSVVDVTDVGGGMVRVKAQGNFIAEGLRVRVGGAILNSNSPNFLAYNDTLSFVVAAQDLATGGAFIINRDGSENAVQDGLRAAPLPAADGSLPPLQVSSHPPVRFKIDSVVTEPFSDSQAKVTISFTNPPSSLPMLNGQPQVNNPLVVTIGGQVFGLSNKPFRSTSPKQIVLLVPIDLIQAQDGLTIGQLLRGSGAQASGLFDAAAYPKANFSVSSTSIVYASDKTLLLLNGLGLDGAAIVDASNPVVPPPDDRTKPDPSKRCLSLTDATHSAYLVVSIEKACASLAKEFLLVKSVSPPIIVTVPKPDAPKPTLKASATVAPGAGKLTLTGDAIDQVTLVRFGRTILTPTLSLDKKTLTVPLTPDITTAEGIRSLEFEMADGTKVRFTLTVQKPSN